LQRVKGELVEIQSHDWVGGVLKDIPIYSKQHDLKEIADALTNAVVAAESLLRADSGISMAMLQVVAKV